jgi:tetratricopeptide (TPR) repeat protein
MTRWLISIGVLVWLLAGAWSEGARIHAWIAREAADRAYYEGDLDEALAQYEIVKRLLPGKPKSHTDPADSIGQALEGEYGRQLEPAVFDALANRAARGYLHAIRCAPPNAWSYAALGSLADTVRSARTSRTGIDLSMMSADLMGNLLPEDRLYEAALVKAVQLEPNNYYYRDFLGDFYLRRGFQDRALAHFRIAAYLQPVLDRHYYLSRLAAVSPAVLSAVEAGINDALESPDTQVPVYDIHRFLAAVYQRMGKLEEARASLEAAVEVAPSPHAVELRIGQIFVKEGKDEEALAAFERSAELKPDFHHAWMHMGLTLSRMGRFDEAVEAALRARGLKPADLPAAQSLASVFESAGRLDDASDLLENLIRTHADRQHLYLQLINIYEGQGQLSYATRVARQLAARYPDEPVFAEQVDQLERAMAETP